MMLSFLFSLSLSLFLVSTLFQLLSPLAPFSSHWRFTCSGCRSSYTDALTCSYTTSIYPLCMRRLVFKRRRRRWRYLCYTGNSPSSRRPFPVVVVVVVVVVGDITHARKILIPEALTIIIIRVYFSLLLDYSLLYTIVFLFNCRWKYWNVPIVFRSSSLLRRNSKLMCHVISYSSSFSLSPEKKEKKKENIENSLEQTITHVLRVAPVDPTRNAFLLSHLSSLVLSTIILLLVYYHNRESRVSPPFNSCRSSTRRAWGNWKKKEGKYEKKQQ